MAEKSLSNQIDTIRARVKSLRDRVDDLEALASPETTADVCNMFDQMGGRNICRTCGHKLGAHKAYKKPEKYADDVERYDSEDWKLLTELAQSTCKLQEGVIEDNQAEITRLNAELNTAYERMEDLLTMAKSGLYGAGNIWSEAGNWFDKHGKAIRPKENEDDN